MSQIISSRRSFLVGLGALIAAPAICRASNLMPVKQMLILPDKIGTITFPIGGHAYMTGTSFMYHDSNGWKELNPRDVLVPPDADARWERMKKREAEARF